MSVKLLFLLLTTTNYLIDLTFRDEFNNLFGDVNYHKKLKSRALKGDLGSCRFRSLCWKLFLECLPENRSEWVTKARELRERYNKIAQSYAINPRGSEEKTPEDPKPFADPLQDNPLSQDDSVGRMICGYFFSLVTFPTTKMVSSSPYRI